MVCPVAAEITSVLLLEYDAKTLLASHAIPVPKGVVVGKGKACGTPPFPAPWIIKGQVPVGGRGKAGAVKKALDIPELTRNFDEIMGLKVHGHVVEECLVEQAVPSVGEHYISFSLDPETAGVAIVLSSEGGMDVEDLPSENLAIGRSPLSEAEIKAEITRLTESLPFQHRKTIRDAALALATVFLSSDLTLLEINPLMSCADGTWIAADAKIIFDESALDRQPFMEKLLSNRQQAYASDAFKRTEGFDFIVLDSDGEIGLITTGAGLTMQVVDELADQNVTAHNFCDIRSGMMRGDPARLIRVLSHFATESRIKAILVNIFAGITNLGEFSQLLIKAVETADGPNVPIVARLIGNAADEAAIILNESTLPFVVESDLDAAIVKVAALAKGEGAANA